MSVTQSIYNIFEFINEPAMCVEKGGAVSLILMSKMMNFVFFSVEINTKWHKICDF